MEALKTGLFFDILPNTKINSTFKQNFASIKYFSTHNNKLKLCSTNLPNLKQNVKFVTLDS